jgi:hypothetical protein
MSLAGGPPLSLNGNALLPDVDGRSVWTRRCRDLIASHTADCGGSLAISEAERSIIRRASVLVPTRARGGGQV